MDVATIEIGELLGHAAWVRGLARCLTHDDASADDLAQEAWLAALRAPPRREGNTRSWLAEVVRNARRMGFRSDARRKLREAQVEAEQTTRGADALAEDVELSRVLGGLLLALDEPYRETLLLSFYGGLTSQQIAQKRGVPAGTVRSHIKTGIERLRDALDRRYGQRDTWKRALMPLTPVAVTAQGALMLKIALACLTVSGATVAATAHFHDKAPHAAGPVMAAPPPVIAGPPPTVAGPPSLGALRALTPALAAARRDHDALLRRIQAVRTTHASPAESGSLDKSAISDSLSQIMPLFKECYEHGLVDHPDLVGRVVVRFTITGDAEIGGAVSDSEVEADKSTLTDPGVRECLQESIYAAQFPAPAGDGVVVVEYPFTLQEKAPDEN